MGRYPDLRRRCQRVLRLKHDAITAVWRTLSQAAVVSTRDEEAEALVDNMVLLLNYWLNYDHLLHEDRPPALIIHQGVYQLMSMVAPYLGEHQRDFYEQLSNIYRNIIVPAAEK